MACNRGARVAECLGEKKEKAKAAKKNEKAVRRLHQFIILAVRVSDAIFGAIEPD